MFELGCAFESGQGVPQSSQEAARWYQQAVDGGFSGAKTNLGRLYMNGTGVPQNFEKGLALLRDPDLANCPVALTTLSTAYEEGTGVEIDLVESTRLLAESADMGYHIAQCNLGCMYEQGVGVEQNFEEARRYFKMASEQGNRVASNNLAALYKRGDGGLIDITAVKYYLKKAREPAKAGENPDSGIFLYADEELASDEAFELLLDIKQTCEWCGEQAENLRMCARCKGPRYCDATCQHADWPEHKKVCGKASIAREERRAADEQRLALSRIFR
jgi:TPR repeat protein